jgi:hypothetical protein
MAGWGSNVATATLHGTSGREKEERRGETKRKVPTVPITGIVRRFFFLNIKPSACGK